jgi:hypothetical protein
MPARHREHHYATPQKAFTMKLESCSRSAGISVHVALETPFTIDRNMQDYRRIAISHDIHGE